MQQQQQKSEFETQLKRTKMNCELAYLTHFVKQGESDVNSVLQMCIENTVREKKKLSHDLTSKISYFRQFYQILDGFIVKKVSRNVDFEEVTSCYIRQIYFMKIVIFVWANSTNPRHQWREVRLIPFFRKFHNSFNFITTSPLNQ